MQQDQQDGLERADRVRVGVEVAERGRQGGRVVLDGGAQEGGGGGTDADVGACAVEERVERVHRGIGLG